MLLGGLAACGGGEPEPCLPGEVCVWAGTGERGYNNNRPDAFRLDSKLYFPEDLTFASDGRAYIADWNNHRIRRVELDGRIVNVVGTDYEGDGAPQQEDRLPLGSPTGALGTDVAMNHPTDMRFGPDGRLYIAAWHNNKIRIWDPQTARLTVLCGDTYGFSGDGGPCYDALFNQPKSLAIAGDGTIYTNDQRNVRIRRIGTDGMVSTISGIGTLGNAGDGGDAMQVQWGFDTGITPRPSGALALVGRTLFVADSGNNRIRKLDLDTNIVTNVAGDPGGTSGYADGIGSDARFDFPVDIELGPDGLLYVADRYNNVIRTVDVDSGAVATVVGNGLPCPSPTQTCTADDRLSRLETQLHEPYGVAFAPDGTLYIADTHNNRILEAP